MRLNMEALGDRAFFENAGIALPNYDVAAAHRETRACPVWAHIGSGNIFRALLCGVQQRLLNAGLAAGGITAIVSESSQTMDALYAPHDNLTLLSTVGADGSTHDEVLGSISEAVLTTDRARLHEIFAADSLQMVSFTITEKGYAWTPTGETPEDATSAIGLATACLLWRHRAGGAPIAMVSMDNCAQNGDRLRAAVLLCAETWAGAGLVEPEFLDALRDPSKVSFPWSMIDKIVPHPSEALQARLRSIGFVDMDIVVTPRGTRIAPFVNAEPCEYLVIEDSFPNGRPPLGRAGVYLGTREMVGAAERMKVTACLNPVHTALAITGCLLGYRLIADEIENPLLKALALRVGQEGMAGLADPGILAPGAFFDELITERLPNRFLGDTPQRIATDTSQKVPVRFGETLKRHHRDGRDVQELVGIPLAIAAWMRYLQGTDDRGNPMPLSPDPLLDTLVTAVAGDIRPILRDASIFGVDLEDYGLSDSILALHRQMQGPGAVRTTLSKHLEVEST